MQYGFSTEDYSNETKSASGSNRIPQYDTRYYDRNNPQQAQAQAYHPSLGFNVSQPNFSYWNSRSNEFGNMNPQMYHQQPQQHYGGQYHPTIPQTQSLRPQFSEQRIEYTSSSSDTTKINPLEIFGNVIKKVGLDKQHNEKMKEDQKDNRQYELAKNSQMFIAKTELEITKLTDSKNGLLETARILKNKKRSKPEESRFQFVLKQIASINSQIDKERIRIANVYSKSNTLREKKRENEFIGLMTDMNKELRADETDNKDDIVSKLGEVADENKTFEDDEVAIENAYKELDICSEETNANSSVLEELEQFEEEKNEQIRDNREYRTLPIENDVKIDKKTHAEIKRENVPNTEPKKSTQKPSDNKEVYNVYGEESIDISEFPPLPERSRILVKPVVQSKQKKVSNNN